MYLLQAKTGQSHTMCTLYTYYQQLAKLLYQYSCSTKHSETRRATALVKECCQLLVISIHREMTHGEDNIKKYIHCLLFHIHTVGILALLCVQVCINVPSGLCGLLTALQQL
jgi:hypothetical protein